MLNVISIMQLNCNGLEYKILVVAVQVSVSNNNSRLQSGNVYTTTRFDRTKSGKGIIAFIVHYRVQYIMIPPY